jgi:hypothetical protein
VDLSSLWDDFRFFCLGIPGHRPLVERVVLSAGTTTHPDRPSRRSTVIPSSSTWPKSLAGSKSCSAWNTPCSSEGEVSSRSATRAATTRTSDLSPLPAAVARDVGATARNSALAPGSPSASLASSGRCFGTQLVSTGGAEPQRPDVLALWDDLRFIRGERRVQNRVRRPLSPLAHDLVLAVLEGDLTQGASSCRPGRYDEQNRGGRSPGQLEHQPRQRYQRDTGCWRRGLDEQEGTRVVGSYHHGARGSATYAVQLVSGTHATASKASKTETSTK